MEATKLIIENIQPQDISGCRPGTREHIAHDTIEFNPAIFELVPAFEFSKGSLCDLRKAVLKTGRTLANATDLDFILKNQNEPSVKKMLDEWKGKWNVFLGTTYYSLRYTCSGEVRILTHLGNMGWSGDIPNCMDGDDILGNFYVVFINLKK